YNNKIGMVKLNKAGTKLWGNVPLMVVGNSGTGEKFNYPIGIKSDNGSIILYWIGYTGTFISPQNYKTYTQKFSSAGAIQWGNPQDTIWSLGSAQGTYQPSVFSDGNNGAIYVWQSYVAGPTNCYVQRKNSAGQIQFPVNGSTVGDVNTDLRFQPSACYMPTTQETYVFWQEKNSTQSMIGVYGQRFSSDGTKQWVSTGFIFKPMDGNSFASLSAYSRDTSVLVYYVELIGAGTTGLVKGFKINRSGTFLWGSGSIITPCSNTSSKGRMSTGVNQNNMSILAFSDGRLDANGIYAQNINYNGTFGPPTGIINSGNLTPDKFVLYQNYPNPFNPATTIKYDLAERTYVTLQIFDIVGRLVETLESGYQTAGGNEKTFEGKNRSGGIYYYKLSAGHNVETRKMVLVK
ncbi:MAG: T9SS type A sorting domain-containing protein, partial [Ignavibacteriae bacterium]|nr:T9SS type A sorting domain-containing protein [Ignavibacteriota bacterium]